MMGTQGFTMVNVAGFCFNVGALIAIDLTEYVSKDDRNIAGQERTTPIIILHLAGPTTHSFFGERADQAHEWYLEITGQKKIEPISFPPRR